MLNSKKNCASDLSASFRRSAVWRRGLRKKYDDARAGRAADTLDQLAKEASNLSDDLWANWKTTTRGLRADGPIQYLRHVG